MGRCAAGACGPFPHPHLRQPRTGPLRRATGGPLSTALLAAEAWDLFEALRVTQPWLIGLSNGSALSLELLSAHPQAFSGAVLTSVMTHFDFAMNLKAEHWAHCLEVGGPLLQFDAVAPFLWGDRFLEARHGVLRAYHQVVTGGERPQHGNLHQIRGTLGWDIRDRLGRIQAPVLLLSGAEDLLTPPWKCLETAKGIRGSRFEVVPGIGHAYPVEDPKGFVARVRDFIAEARPVWPIRKSDLSCQQSRATLDSPCP